MTRQLILAAALAVGLFGCGKAQEGHLLYATEMLLECRFSEAVSAARDVRSIGPEDSDEFIASLLIEAVAAERLGEDPTTLLEEFASLSPSVGSVAEAEEVASRSFGRMLAECPE